MRASLRLPFTLTVIFSLIRVADLADGFKCHKCTGESCKDPLRPKNTGVTVEECSVFKGKPMCMKAISDGVVTRQCMQGTSCTLPGADTYRAWCCDQPFCNHGNALRPEVIFTTFLLVAALVLRHGQIDVR